MTLATVCKVVGEVVIVEVAEVVETTGVGEEEPPPEDPPPDEPPPPDEVTTTTAAAAVVNV